MHISQTIFTFGCAKIVWRTSSHTFITFGTMKRYIASVSALAIALAAMAVPAKRIQFTADQADGTGPWTCTGSVAPSIASNKGTGISSGGELTSPEINAAGRQLITVEYEAKAFSTTSHDIRFHTVADGVASAKTARELEYTTDWGTYIDVVVIR